MALPSSNVLTPESNTGSLSVNDVVDLFADDPIDDKKQEEVIPELKPKEEELEIEEEEPEKEEEIELEGEPSEDKLELTTPIKRQEILKAYPDLFKKFPYLEKAYYREQAYTELLPTIDDAKEAIEARDSLKKFEHELLSGNTLSILETVKKTDEKAFAKIVDNYLPALAKVDQNAYFHILGNINKAVVSGMAREAQKTGNEDLKNAAVILNQYIFGNSEFVPAEKFSKGPDTNPEEEKLKKEREDFHNEKLQSVVSDLQSRADNAIKSTISSHIDPKNVMTDYVKRNAIKESVEMLSEAFKHDSRFQTLKDKLWEKAKASNFSPSTVDAIKSAYLSKAKALLPEIITKARNDALKGLGKRESTEEPKKGPLPVGRTASAPKRSNDGSSNKNGNENAARGKKTLDFFNED